MECSKAKIIKKISIDNPQILTREDEFVDLLVQQSVAQQA